MYRTVNDVLRSLCTAGLLALLPSNPVLSQTFTQITTGAIVNDNTASGGGAWIDFDEDGLLDLFVANGNTANQANALFQNVGGGQFTKVSEGQIVTDAGSSIGGTFGDFDGDGLLDAYVTNRGTAFPNLLYRNNGDATFTRITSGAPATDAGDANNSYWLDLDRDGDLDLFVLNFNQANFLYLNNGDATFTRSTTGSVVSDASLSISGAWADYNDDGNLDFFMANAGSQNDVLYVNNGDGSFSKRLFADASASLGASWGDYDNDGDLDLVVASFLGQNNFLYENSGAPDFALPPVASVVAADGGSSVGTAWGDIDNDGDLDLLVGNDDRSSFLYLNNGDKTFSRVTTGALVTGGGNTFGANLVDFNGDGYLDAFAANRIGVNFLYRNDGGSSHWLKVRCVAEGHNTSGFGATVRLKATISGKTAWLRRDVSSQSGYNSQSDLAVHFGLADATVVDSLIVSWPSGATSILANLAVDRRVVVEENEMPTSVSSPGTPRPTVFRLLANYPNPFNPSTNIVFELSRSEHVRLEIFNLLGSKVRTLVDANLIQATHTVTWDGRDQGNRIVPSGVYFYRLAVSGAVVSRKMVFAK